MHKFILIFSLINFTFFGYSVSGQPGDSISQRPIKHDTSGALSTMLPLIIYFHNDEPDPRSTDSTTTENYLNCFKNYFALKDKYEVNCSHLLKGEHRESAKKEIADFFINFSKKGMENLDLFSTLLLQELKKGSQIQLEVKAYASPLAKAGYNVNLSKRRISSLINYFLEKDQGAFKPYLEKNSPDGGSLGFIPIAFGEQKADRSVSDNLYDQQNSVFSKKAALERRVEIVSIKKINSAEVIPQLSFEHDEFDFGSVRQGEKISHIFSLMNSGQGNLLLKNVSSSCGCTVAKWTRNELGSGQKGEIEVSFDTAGKLGKHHKTVMIETNGVPSTKILQISAEIIP